MNKIWIIAAAAVVILAGSFFLFISLQKSEKQASLSTPESYEVVQTDGGSYKNINSAQLAEMLKSKDFVFVNTHIPYEGEIAVTDAFIAYNEIEKNLDKLPTDKNAKIVLYCRSGRMSEIAAKTMVKLGYTNIWNHTGGMIEWEKQGNVLLHKQG
jgi:rhodanese-related sulfurtransferase